MTTEPGAPQLFDAGAFNAETNDETFEVLYAGLEAVTAQLEAGDLTLEQSVALYEEGMRIAQRCQALLAQVEQRIETLRETYDNGFEL